MANTIVNKTLEDGSRNVIINLTIEGDGSGDETDYPLINVHDLEPKCDSLALMSVKGNLEGFSIKLSWDGSSKPIACDIRDDDGNQPALDWSLVGGLADPRMANYKGNLLMTTTGLGGSDEGTVQIWCKKKGRELVNIDDEHSVGR